MYHSYNSLREPIQREIESQKSVLNKFPDNISRPITQTVSKYLAQFTSFQLPFKSEKQQQQQQQQQQQPQQLQSLNAQQQQQQQITNSSVDLVNMSVSAQLSSSSMAIQSRQVNNKGNTSQDQVDKLNIIQLETSEQVNWTLEVF